MILTAAQLIDELPPSIYFLWWLAKLSNSVASPVPIPIKAVVGAAQVGAFIGEHTSKYDNKRIGEDGRRFGEAFSSIALTNYEHSALGSSRIL